MKPDVEIYDTTLRDGTQGEGINFSVADKLRIAERLDAFGVHYIEGGWPGSNPKDIEFFDQAKRRKFKHARLAAFGSTRRKGVPVEQDEQVRLLVEAATPEHIDALRAHVAAEQSALKQGDVADRSELLGDFHVRMAQLIGNDVLAEVLRDLLARCAIATLVYQSSSAAHDSAAEHAALVECFATGNVAQAVRLMREHLDHVEAGLNLDQPGPSDDLKTALARA